MRIQTSRGVNRSNSRWSMRFGTVKYWVRVRYIATVPSKPGPITDNNANSRYLSHQDDTAPVTMWNHLGDRYPITENLDTVSRRKFRSRHSTTNPGGNDVVPEAGGDPDLWFSCRPSPERRGGELRHLNFSMGECWDHCPMQERKIKGGGKSH